MHAHDSDEAVTWDEFYASDGDGVAQWSGRPNGTLLFVHHEIDPAHGDEHRFDPADYVMPADVAAHLDDGWKIQVHETRPRTGPVPPGTHHIRDLILRARRRTSATGSAY